MAKREWGETFCRNIVFAPLPPSLCIWFIAGEMHVPNGRKDSPKADCLGVLPVAGHLAATKRKFVYFVKMVDRRLGFSRAWSSVGLVCCWHLPSKPNSAECSAVSLAVSRFFVCQQVLASLGSAWAKVQRKTKTNHMLLHRANCLLCFLHDYKLCWARFFGPASMCNICILLV